MSKLCATPSSYSCTVDVRRQRDPSAPQSGHAPLQPPGGDKQDGWPPAPTPLHFAQPLHLSQYQNPLEKDPSSQLQSHHVQSHSQNPHAPTQSDLGADFLQPFSSLEALGEEVPAQGLRSSQAQPQVEVESRVSIVKFGSDRERESVLSSRRLEPIKIDVALSFLDRVKSTFGEDGAVYGRLVDIMISYKKEELSPEHIWKQVAELFRDHDDVLYPFVQFLPPDYAKAPVRGTVEPFGSQEMTERRREDEEV